MVESVSVNRNNENFIKFSSRVQVARWISLWAERWLNLNKPLARFIFNGSSIIGLFLSIETVKILLNLVRVYKSLDESRSEPDGGW